MNHSYTAMRACIDESSIQLPADFRPAIGLRWPQRGPELEKLSGSVESGFRVLVATILGWPFWDGVKQDYRVRDLVKRIFPMGSVHFRQLSLKISTKTLDFWSVACPLLAPSRPVSLLLSVDSPGRPSYEAGQSALRSREPRPGRWKKFGQETKGNGARQD